jgi:hypothetical protein
MTCFIVFGYQIHHLYGVTNNYLFEPLNRYVLKTEPIRFIP